jgi:D-xylose transport system substrate-binding protein
LRHKGSVARTAERSTAEGIQNIVAGNQCMTVYKAITDEAEATAELAVALRNGEEASQAEDTVDTGSAEIPAVLLEPVAVTEDNITETVIADGFRTVEEICTGDVADTDWCQNEASGGGGASEASS